MVFNRMTKLLFIMLNMIIISAHSQKYYNLDFHQSSVTLKLKGGIKIYSDDINISSQPVIEITTTTLNMNHNNILNIDKLQVGYKKEYDSSGNPYYVGRDLYSTLDIYGNTLIQGGELYISSDVVSEYNTGYSTGAVGDWSFSDYLNSGWSNYSYASLMDNQYATFWCNTSGCSLLLNFSFEGNNNITGIPDNAIIKGVEAFFKGHASGDSAVQISICRLIKYRNGSILEELGVNKCSSPEVLNSSDRIINWGSSSDDWGSNGGLDKNHAGIEFKFEYLTPPATLYIDSIQMKLYYTTDEDYSIKQKDNVLQINYSTQTIIEISTNGINVIGNYYQNGELFSGGGSGDNLGNHIATTTLNMNGNAIINASNISAQYLYGDGSNITNISGDNLGNHIATTTLEMSGYDITNINNAYVKNLNTPIGNSNIVISTDIFIKPIQEAYYQQPSYSLYIKPYVKSGVYGHILNMPFILRAEGHGEGGNNFGEAFLKLYTRTIDSSNELITINNSNNYGKRIGILKGGSMPYYTLDVNGSINGTSLCISGDCKTNWNIIGDNLGNHIATTTLNMSFNDIINVSTITSNTYCIGSDCITSWASGGGSGDNLGNHIATMTLNMSNYPIVDVSSLNITGTGVSGSPLLSVAGSTFVVSNGRVGIGTNNPQAKLHINADASQQYALTISNASDGYSIFITTKSDLYIEGSLLDRVYYSYLTQEVNYGTSEVILLSKTINTNGRTLVIIGKMKNRANEVRCYRNRLFLYRDTTLLDSWVFWQTAPGPIEESAVVTAVDSPPKGTYTYYLKASGEACTRTAKTDGTKLIIYAF